MSKMNGRQIRAGLDKMAPVEKKLFQDGFVDQYVRMVRESGARRNILNSIANLPPHASASRWRSVRSARKNSKPSSASKESWIAPALRSATRPRRQLAELGLARGYNLYEGGGHASTDPDVLMKTLAVYGALHGSRALGSHR